MSSNHAILFLIVGIIAIFILLELLLFLFCWNYCYFYFGFFDSFNFFTIFFTESCCVCSAGIDLLNHGGAAANGQLVLGKASWQVDGEAAVCFVTSTHIPAGQQVRAS
jgi:hypothetical protein